MVITNDFSFPTNKLSSHEDEVIATSVHFVLTQMSPILEKMSFLCKALHKQINQPYIIFSAYRDKLEKSITPDQNAFKVGVNVDDMLNSQVLFVIVDCIWRTFGSNIQTRRNREVWQGILFKK